MCVTYLIFFMYVTHIKKVTCITHITNVTYGTYITKVTCVTDITNVTYVTDITKVTCVTHITNVTYVTYIMKVTCVTDITNITNVTHITNLKYTMAYTVGTATQNTMPYTSGDSNTVFVVAQTLPHDEITVFGKSQPDLAFYKGNGEFIKQKKIMGAAITDATLEVTAAAMEFKKTEVHLKIKSPAHAQLCANMVKLGGYLTGKALSKGKVVEEVNIFGLLVSHSCLMCIPLRYSSHVDRKTEILRGDELLFSQAIAVVLGQLN